jgi:hypothetical protein
MAEKTEGKDTGTEAFGAEPTDAIRCFIIGFVIVFALCLAAFGWHYRTPNTSQASCADPEAHCRENKL